MNSESASVWGTDPRGPPEGYAGKVRRSRKGVDMKAQAAALAKRRANLAAKGMAAAPAVGIEDGGAGAAAADRLVPLAADGGRDKVLAQAEAGRQKRRADVAALRKGTSAVDRLEAAREEKAQKRAVRQQDRAREIAREVEQQRRADADAARAEAAAKAEKRKAEAAANADAARAEAAARAKRRKARAAAKAAEADLAALVAAQKRDAALQRKRAAAAQKDADARAAAMERDIQRRVARNDAENARFQREGEANLRRIQEEEDAVAKARAQRLADEDEQAARALAAKRAGAPRPMSASDQPAASNRQTAPPSKRSTMASKDAGFMEQGAAEAAAGTAPAPLDAREAYKALAGDADNVQQIGPFRVLKVPGTAFRSRSGAKGPSGVGGVAAQTDMLRQAVADIVNWNFDKAGIEFMSDEERNIVTGQMDHTPEDVATQPDDYFFTNPTQKVTPTDEASYIASAAPQETIFATIPDVPSGGGDGEDEDEF